MIGANHPKVRFRAILELVTPIATTYPKYRLKYWGGERVYLEMLQTNLYGKENRDKDSRKGIYITLKPNQTKKTSAPEMNLQTNKGQNLTGLKQWFDNGRLSGYAYGEPDNKKTFGGKNPKPNCFYQYQTDGFLFRCTPSSDLTNVIPTQIEWIVLQGGQGVKIHAAQYLTLLRTGGLKSELDFNPLYSYDDEDFSNI